MILKEHEKEQQKNQIKNNSKFTFSNIVLLVTMRHDSIYIKSIIVINLNTDYYESRSNIYNFFISYMLHFN